MKIGGVVGSEEGCQRTHQDLDEMAISMEERRVVFNLEMFLRRPNACEKSTVNGSSEL